MVLNFFFKKNRINLGLQNLRLAKELSYKINEKGLINILKK